MKSLLPEALKVLVVDDDAQMLRTITDILRLRGYSTLIAATGREALNITRDMNEAPAVALVDLQLPDMDGIELIGRLREIAELTEVVDRRGDSAFHSGRRRQAGAGGHIRVDGHRKPVILGQHLVPILDGRRLDFHDWGGHDHLQSSGSRPLGVSVTKSMRELHHDTLRIC